MLTPTIIAILVPAVILIVFLMIAIRILPEYERGVVFRLGRVINAKGPGLIILIPVIDKMVKVSLRLVALDVDPQDVITRDNVSVKVNAVIYFRVIDPIKAIIEVENYSYAMSQLAQTTIRSVCGQAELDDLLAEREKINAELQEILDTHTDPWGIKVATVELKHIDLPQEMQRAMARQAEAVKEQFEERARSLFQRTPLGWNVETIEFLYAWALALPLKIPDLLAHIHCWLESFCGNWGLVDNLVPSVLSPLLRARSGSGPGCRTHTRSTPLLAVSTRTIRDTEHGISSRIPFQMRCCLPSLEAWSTAQAPFDYSLSRG